ncbi:Cytochrome c family protein MtrB [Thermosulfurimonas dismutans]|uniref:Cytochrome c family protein MtrB n=3 Tax=Thermosulfurimonas dismutans TaxID=999894 RepID=A0A179D5V3_9BACT|nr:Cytochrome c family protein MtrB [Thermosulfurimonas dismutans]
MRRLILLLMALGLVLTCSQAWAEDEKSYELEVNLGASVNDYGDVPNRAAEYKSQVDMDSSWYIGGKFSLAEKDFLLNLEGRYIEVNDQEYSGSLDFRRLFSFKSNYYRFYHRLDRDLMENLQATATEYRGGTWYPEKYTSTFTPPSSMPDVKDIDNDGVWEGASAAVWHDSYEKVHHYGVTRSLWKNDAILRLPTVPGVVLGFTHRMEERKGWDQARTVSKCSSCHVAAYSKYIEEYTNDYIPYIEARLGRWTVRYSLMYRSFNTSSDVPRHLYLNAQGPAPTTDPAAALKPDFGLAPGEFPGEGGLNYDYSDGELPFARTPESEKWQHTLKAKWDISSSQILNLGFVYSEATNESSDEAEGGSGLLYGDAGEELEVDYLAFSGNWHWRLRKDMSLTVKAKYHTMDGDDVYIQLDPYYNPADPTIDGKDFSFNRKSAYDEDEYIFSADLSWRYSRELAFRFGYELEYIDRKNAEEHHVTDETTEHLFKLGATWKPMAGLKVKADYNFLYVDDPYAFKHAACPEEAIGTSVGGTDYTPVNSNPDNPWNYSWYSYTVYGRRHADTTNQPEMAHDLGVKVDYILSANLNTNFYLKYRYAENEDDTDGYNWEQNTFMGGVNVTYTPMEKFGVNVGYNFFWDEYTSMLCAAVYHG